MKRKVKIVNEGVKFDKSKYGSVFGDYDKDGVLNIDDANPMDKSKKGLVEPVKASESFSSLLELKKDLDSTMMKSIEVLKKNTPESADLYARTKTPYSIIKKLVEKRLLDPKKGLQDLIGTTIAVENYDELIKVRNDIRKGILGEVIEEEDMYESPKNGYMAYHYIVSVNNIPVEVQLKTKRMKKLNEVGHQFYKTGTFNVKNALKLAKLTNKADKGDAKAIEQYDAVMNNKEALKKTLQTSSKKAEGGTLKPNFNDAEYFTTDEIIRINLKDGRVIENDWSGREGQRLLAGLHVSKTPITGTEDPNQLTLFERGGKMPSDTVYIKRSEIDSVEIGDSIDEVDRVIKGSHLHNGMYFNNPYFTKLISEAKSEKRLAKGGGVDFVNTEGNTEITKIYKADTPKEKKEIASKVKKEYKVKGKIDVDKKSKISYVAIEESDELRKAKAKAEAKRKAKKVTKKAMGGEVITEYDDLPTKVQNALNRDYDEDGDPYDEAKKMQERLNDIGWDMDYDLSGTPTEFWKHEEDDSPTGYCEAPSCRKAIYDGSEYCDTDCEDSYAKGGLANRNKRIKVDTIKGDRYFERLTYSASDSYDPILNENVSVDTALKDLEEFKKTNKIIKEERYKYVMYRDGSFDVWQKNFDDWRKLHEYRKYKLYAKGGGVGKEVYKITERNFRTLDKNKNVVPIEVGESITVVSRDLYKVEFTDVYGNRYYETPEDFKLLTKHETLIPINYAKGGKLMSELSDTEYKRLRYLMERRDEELDNLVKLGRNTIEEKRKIIDYYDERMKKEKLLSQGGAISSSKNGGWGIDLEWWK